MINIGIYVFDEVEVLDFSGPYSVFSCANKLGHKNVFNVFLISNENEVITTQNGIRINTDCHIENLEGLDILVIPGGSGARDDSKHEEICKYIINEHSNFKYLLSVCTGALILAKTGLLKGKNVTTHKNAFEDIKRIDPSLRISSTSSVVVNGNIVMTTGVLTGIEGGLKILEEICGNELMEKVKDNLYYNSIL